jgi:hypothetical protein
MSRLPLVFLSLVALCLVPACSSGSGGSDAITPAADNGGATDGVLVPPDAPVTEDVAATPDLATTETTTPAASGFQATINGKTIAFTESLVATIYADAAGTSGETAIQGVAAKTAGSMVGAVLDLRIDGVVPGTYDCSIKYTAEIVDSGTPYDKFSTSSDGTCTATLVTSGKTGGSVSGTFEGSGTVKATFTITNGTFGAPISLYNAPPG